MNPLRYKLWLIGAILWCFCTQSPLRAADYKRNLVVAADGSGDYTSLNAAMDGIRAFMDYRVTVHIKKGIYKEKWVVPSWIEHVDFIGESVEETIITFDDHAKVRNMGTFRTYTLKVEGNHLTFSNLTIENNAEPLGQAVALHTVGDDLTFVHCRFLGNQDTVFTGAAHTHLRFTDCYIEGTTDFIFGPSTALFEACEIHSKADSYVTAASTPEEVPVGYLFLRCRLTAASGVGKVYLGRPWRPFAHTLFMECELGSHIRPEGWHNWRNPANEQTARYAECRCYGPGADRSARAGWSRELSDEEAERAMDYIRAVTSRAKETVYKE